MFGKPAEGMLFEVNGNRNAARAPWDLDPYVITEEVRRVVRKSFPKIVDFDGKRNPMGALPIDGYCEAVGKSVTREILDGHGVDFASKHVVHVLFDDHIADAVRLYVSVVVKVRDHHIIIIQVEGD